MSSSGDPEIVVDVSELYFMNSSCLKAFASWIHQVDSSQCPHRIKLLSNARQHWQRRSLDTPRRLAPAVIDIEQVTSALPSRRPTLEP